MLTWHGAVDPSSFDCGPVMFEQADRANVASAMAMVVIWRRDIGETSRTGVEEADWVAALRLLGKLGSRGSE